MRDITSSLRDRSLRYAVERPGDGLLEYPALAPKSSSSAWVPMLETEPLLTQRPPQFALLREFTIELSPRDSASNEDMIFLDQSTDPDGRHRDVIAHALTVARRLFEKHTGQSAGTSFNVHCRFNEPGIVIGESMGLAAAAATFCELLRVSQSRQQVTLSSRVAFTGTLSEDGTAMPVDEVGLRLKLEACIYSHVSHVVLPKSQLTVAEALFSHPTYASIRGALPILIAIERLEEVFYDRRISNVIRVPLYRVLAKNVWRFRRSVAVALILLLGAMLAYEILGPFDKNPQFGEFKDKWLIVNNRHHEELAQFDVGGEIVKAANKRRFGPKVSPIYRMYKMEFEDKVGVPYDAAAQHKFSECCRDGMGTEAERDLFAPMLADYDQAVDMLVGKMVADLRMTQKAGGK